MEIKHYIDIVQLREETIDTGMSIVEKNDTAFIPGDIISITEKVDGSNASIRYDAETGTLAAFSRKQKLSYDNTLDGFWNYIQTLNPYEYVYESKYSVFGEWCRKNKIVYNADAIHKWYVYSIFDNENGVWLDQDFVKAFCERHDLIYVHELYYGPFVSWEHCRSFCHSPAYGEDQEGVVVRNITALKNPSERTGYHILKIVNDDFKERVKTRTKILNPEVEQAKKNAQTMMEDIITRYRVEKELYKMRDEQLIPETLTPNDMGFVAKILPKRIYEDCVKEDIETITACGEYAGKACSGITMKHARAIILGE